MTKNSHHIGPRISKSLVLLCLLHEPTAAIRSDHMYPSLLWSTTTCRVADTGTSDSTVTALPDKLLNTCLGNNFPACNVYCTFLIRLGNKRTLEKSAVHVVPFPQMEPLATVDLSLIPRTLLWSTMTWSIKVKGSFDWSNWTIGTPV